MVDHLWAGWRLAYLEAGDSPRVETPEGMTLFEAILAS